MLGCASTGTRRERGELVSRVDVGLRLIQQIDHEIVLGFASTDDIHADPLRIRKDPGIARDAVVTLLALWILQRGRGHWLIKQHGMAHTGLYVSSSRLDLLGSQPA